MNTVRDAHGRIAGWRCRECSDVFPHMWGDVCNGCREKERRHNEMLANSKQHDASIVADSSLAKIMRDMRSRVGIGHAWSELDVDTRNEIVAAWRAFIIASIADPLS